MLCSLGYIKLVSKEGGKLLKVSRGRFESSETKAGSLKPRIGQLWPAFQVLLDCLEREVETGTDKQE